MVSIKLPMRSVILRKFGQEIEYFVVYTIHTSYFNANFILEDYLKVYWPSKRRCSMRTSVCLS